MEAVGTQCLHSAARIRTLTPLLSCENKIEVCFRFVALHCTAALTAVPHYRTHETEGVPVPAVRAACQRKLSCDALYSMIDEISRSTDVTVRSGCKRVASQTSDAYGP